MVHQNRRPSKPAETDPQRASRSCTCTAVAAHLVRVEQRVPVRDLGQRGGRAGVRRRHARVREGRGGQEHEEVCAAVVAEGPGGPAAVCRERRPHHRRVHEVLHGERTRSRGEWLQSGAGDSAVSSALILRTTVTRARASEQCCEAVDVRNGVVRTPSGGCSRRSSFEGAGAACDQPRCPGAAARHAAQPSDTPREQRKTVGKRT